MNPHSPPGPVRVRFAPSPTGYLHIGGVRTAYFNWLFARRHGGAFVLRVDDTDTGRNDPRALEPILDGFRWLGLDWDEGPGVDGPCGPYFQSQRAERYRAAVEKLLAGGFAYRDYARPDEIQAERAAAETAGRAYRASRGWAAYAEDDRKPFEAQGRTFVVRLKMPREGECRIPDLVKGEVVTAWASEADHVVQRADGTFLYHLASVVDDVEMRISHVIRAEEHLSNTPRQLWIWQGLGVAPPALAHLPVVAEPGSKVKLSKRKLDKYLKNPEFAELYAHGRRIAERLGRTVEADTFNPVIVDFYRTTGFEPDAILNYLMLLGWSLDGTTEILDAAERIAQFSLAGVNQAAASFDPQKLMSFEERWFGRLAVDERTERCLPFLDRARLIGTPLDRIASDRERALARAIVAAAGDRIKVAGDILDYPEFFVEDEKLTYDEKAFDKRIRHAQGAPELLKDLRAELAAAAEFTPPSLEGLFLSFTERRQLPRGQIVHAVRVAVSGRAIGFGLFDILSLLGRERVVARLDRALSRAAG
jgi:glutamyl-tRNA synthetase